MQFTLKNGQLLEVRPALHQDAEALVQQMKLVGGETDFLVTDHNGIPGLTPEAERTYLDALRKNPRSDVLVGLAGPELVATLGITAATPQRICHNASIGIAVKKQWWGLGVGSAMLAACIGFARQRGILNLTLELRADNERALGLYRRFGFKECGRHARRYNIRGELFDEILMQLCL